MTDYWVIYDRAFADREYVARHWLEADAGRFHLDPHNIISSPDLTILRKAIVGFGYSRCIAPAQPGDGDHALERWA